MIFRLFTIAVLLRVAVFVAATQAYHISLTDYCNKDDGESYIKYAKAMWGDKKDFREYDLRVFPGYPTMIAALHWTGLPFTWCALAIDFTCAGVAAAGAYSLFGEKRVGLAMLYLVPHYLLISSLAMSEAPVLAFTLVALFLVHRRKQVAIGGIVFGLAMLIRPMACFAAAGSMAVLLLDDGNWRKVGNLMLAAVVPLAGALAVMFLVTGDALRNVHIYQNEPWAYRGGILRPPFYSLVMTPIREHVHLGVVAYMYAHVVLVFIGCAILARRVLTPNRSANAWLDRLAFTWLIGNTVFQICIGSQWGFRHFPRFAMPAQPALFWAICPYLPRRALVWCIGGVAVIATSVVGVHLSP